jgi:nitroreductase
MSTEILAGATELAALTAARSAAKAAQTRQPVHELIGQRWSPRAFSEREVTDEQLISLLEAARWAASSYNEQPWRFIVARKSDPETYEKLAGSLMEVNQLWARNAPILILTLAKQTFSHNGAANHYAMHDAGMAMSNLALQATALGLSIHFMGGFNRDAARTAFQIPDDYELGAVAAIGFAGDPEALSESFRKGELAPRTRKPLSELIYAGLPATELWSTVPGNE